MRTPTAHAAVRRAEVIGANLRALAKLRKLTLAHIGRAVGLSRNQMWTISQGAPNTPFATLEAIAAVLNVTVGELAGPPAPAGSRRRRSAA